MIVYNNILFFQVDQTWYDHEEMKCLVQVK